MTGYSRATAGARWLRQELVLAVPHVQDRDHEGGNDDYTDADSDRSGDVFRLMAEHIRTKAIECRPDDAARDIGYHEAASRHAVCPRKQGRQCTQAAR